MGGLRYEVHRMPQSLRDKVVAQVLAKVSARGADADPRRSDDEQEDPCMTCPRWSECNGVAKGMECPF